MGAELGYDEIDRPDYCACQTPWQTRTGPLKDGSHYHDCMAADVAEATALLQAVIEASRAFLNELDANVVGSTADYIAEASERLRAALIAIPCAGDQWAERDG